jgi:hypothetical protein
MMECGAWVIERRLPLSPFAASIYARSGSCLIEARMKFSYDALGSGVFALASRALQRQV